MIELDLKSDRDYRNPFTDVRVTAALTSPSGDESTVVGFYDGDHTWRIRFRPRQRGEWRYKVTSEPSDPGLTTESSIEAYAESCSRFLQATPGVNWGFTYADGEPCFLLGDTFYNLFGAAYGGIDVEPLLLRRAEQGFNLFRARCAVSPQHPRSPKNVWHPRSTWPWGGDRDDPQLDGFNLDYFQNTVDKVMILAEQLDVGFEMILEAWGFELPFNDRARFTEELERLWIEYLVARYDAFNSVYIWTLMNEYEYYPDGKWGHEPEADEWAIRAARWLKSVAPHGHPVAVHNGPAAPPFAKRFANDLAAIDVIMFQTWGTAKENDAWLAAGIEDVISESLSGWPGSAVFVEYGYERAKDVDCLPPSHNYLTVDHTRRGAWRGAFSALGVGNGFGYTWGPYLVVDRDQPGVAQLALVRHFFTEVVRFKSLRPRPELILSSNRNAEGELPLCLADDQCEQVVVYMPAGGATLLDLPKDREYKASWFDPRTGDLQPAKAAPIGEFTAPAGAGPNPDDWALVLTQKSSL